MKKILNYLSTLTASFRPFVIAAVCAVFLFTSAAPALAIGGSNSSPSKGLEQLNTVQKKSENTISGKLSSNNDGKSVMKNSAEGLNGVQGAGDKENMYSPKDSSATSVEENIQEALEEITP
ncbi:hypothetical protein S7335_4322 [Synechococcus sp. PCC 7335]|uniref:hypothetical protein n=1 Tax=Synechococcus sp. (strain ATCC 29403 / PCC 7335) TaxID=91464 RepID=UPI00017ED8D2|nr:hypothetical protein [Synechococcus sp. PCC 7335]EDX86617.1 hypothetical protein S7335_4322 [Synechococcus sp. PCC 7335]